MGSQLADLPNELLIRIFSNIHDQRYLAEIVLLSRQFKAIVEILLYRRITLYIQYTADDAEELRKRGDINKSVTIPNFVPFDRLIETLSVQRHLSKYVHTLALRVHRRLFLKPFAAQFRLIEQFPELRSLSLNSPALLSIIPHNDWALKSVQLDFRDSHVVGHYGDYDGLQDWLDSGVPLDLIAMYLQLPRIRKVQVEGALFTSNFEKTRHLPTGNSSVEDLRFLNCCKGKRDRVIASFLRSVKHLKRFVIEIPSYPHGTLLPTLDTAAFELALSERQNSIEELAIATKWGPSVISWSLGPFTQWGSLRRLAVPGHMISGVAQSKRDLYEILPPQLEEFQIEHSGHDNRILAQVTDRRSMVSAPRWPETYKNMTDAASWKDFADIRQVAENKDIYIPRLNSVIWWYLVPDWEPNSQCPTHRELVGLIGVFLAFKEVGVQFKWVVGPFFKDTPFGKRLCEWQE